MLGAILSLGAALGALKVAGASTCPAPAAVAAQLHRMLPSEVKGELVALVEPAPRGVRLELRSPSGESLESKLLEGQGACQELAAAAAVVVATWLTELDSGALEPPEPARPPGPDRSPPETDLGFDVAAGVTGSLSETGVSLGVLLTTTLTPPGGGYGARLSVAALSPKAVRVGPGVVTCQRFGLGLGAQRRLLLEAWRLDLSFEVAPALLALTGDEKAAAASTAAFDLGMWAGVRAMSPPGLWVGLFGHGWLLPRGFSVEGQSAEAPRLEVSLAAGISWASG